MKATEILATLMAQTDGDLCESSHGSEKRRPRLTLRHLHRLRQISELRKLEAEQQRELVAAMYGGSFEESDEGKKDSRNPPKSVKPPKPFKPLEPSSKYLDKHARTKTTRVSKKNP